MIYTVEVRKIKQLVEELKELNNILENEQIKNIVLDFEEILEDKQW